MRASVSSLGSLPACPHLHTPVSLWAREDCSAARAEEVATCLWAGLP